MAFSFQQEPLTRKPTKFADHATSHRMPFDVRNHPMETARPDEADSHDATDVAQEYDKCGQET